MSGEFYIGTVKIEWEEQYGTVQFREVSGKSES